MNEKCCASCKETKPVAMFGLMKNRRGEHVPQSYCKRCRCRMSAASKRRVKRSSREDNSPGWPMPAMGLTEQLECLRLRKWGGAQPNARFGVPSIGVAA